ncbi:flavodoxin [Malaciobacter molluscorum LMG 25693]|uniref:Flavodoxin n=1 Tax=Malaciobacter molluscorum LMG 25693 TaxID=870501 RepID=A0A2G1DER9_9BACT|nr:flavodoxin [Malaciobacter molluscorum]AXX93078.1 flavodoxin [Malaciobacter molluscorum LMG 25693]PHO16954.1 flavodoxin [Malaciobacter molluscorum LMG 25693]RXJ95548.1 flavodoxin [Malaciobacter molluscorum]
MATALFYASSTGNTEEVAHKIADKLNGIDIFNISDKSIENINSYDNLIIGTPTWGEGDLQDDWDEKWEEFCALDLSNKTIALFGLGDQDSYGDEFCDALGIMYEQIKKAGANIIGFTSIEGYEHEYSKAQIDDEFVGLVIDEDNQDDLTDERIENWTDQIKNDIL